MSRSTGVCADKKRNCPARLLVEIAKLEAALSEFKGEDFPVERRRLIDMENKTLERLEQDSRGATDRKSKHHVEELIGIVRSARNRIEKVVGG